ARLVRTADALAAHHEACGGEVRPGHELHEVGDGRVRVVDEVDGGVQHLAHVVGRDVGGHADRDAGGPVHQEVREPAGQHERLGGRVVVVGPEVHSLLVDVRQQLVCQAVDPALGVAHGRG